MYCKHFGILRNPFSLTPDPNFLFLTSKHREALAGMLFAVNARRGFLVLSGNAGTGKSTLVQKLVRSVPSTCAQFSVVVNPTLEAPELLEHVLMDFGVKDVPCSKTLRLAILKELLLKAHREGKTSVLVIDEAHLLSADLLEEIRLLSNLETVEEKLLLVFLVGQEELTTILERDSLRQFKQRIALRLTVDPLQSNELNRYLQTRWIKAGAESPLPFSEEAIQLVGRCSEGIPRIINAICDAALVNAFGSGRTEITVDNIAEVISDLRLTSIPSPAASIDHSVGVAALPEAHQTANRTALDPAPLKSPEGPLPGSTLNKGSKLFRWTDWFGSPRAIGAK